MSQAFSELLILFHFAKRFIAIRKRRYFPVSVVLKLLMGFVSHKSLFIISRLLIGIFYD